MEKKSAVEFPTETEFNSKLILLSMAVRTKKYCRNKSYCSYFLRPYWYVNNVLYIQKNVIHANSVSEY